MQMFEYTRQSTHGIKGAVSKRIILRRIIKGPLTHENARTQQNIINLDDGFFFGGVNTSGSTAQLVDMVSIHKAE